MGAAGGDQCEEDAREKAAQEAPRVYVEQGALQTAIDELRSLPAVVSGAETLQAVAPEIRGAIVEIAGQLDHRREL